jgi:hypothetical protein
VPNPNILLWRVHIKRAIILTLSLVLLRYVMVQPKLSVMGNRTLLHGPLFPLPTMFDQQGKLLVRNQLLSAVTLAIDEVVRR